MMKFWILILSLFLSSFGVIQAQKSNPFNLQRGDSLIQEQKSDSVIKENQNEIKIESDNPFSVTHIPIRKNQYEQIEQLTIKDRGQKENISLSYLPLWIVVLSLCLLSFIIIRKKNHIFTLIRSIFNNNLLRLIAYEENAGFSLVYLSGYFLFIVNVALFIYLVAEKAFNISIAYSYAWILLICLVYFWGKHLVLSMFSRLYKFEKEARVYSFAISTLNNLLALFFLTLNVILLFGPDNWIRVLALLGIFVFIIFLFSRYYKGLTISRKYLNDNFFHFFLYFCAFEFSPWLIVYSLVRDFI